MLKIFFSEIYHSFIVKKWGWAQQMLFYFLVSGTHSLVTVHQPPVLTTALGHDVIMPCHLNLSHNEKMVTPPVLYWVYITQDGTDNPRLWLPSEKYDGRVELLDNNPNTSSKSILLKNVLWADSGKYQCKVSVITEGDRFRRRGNDTLLMVYDTMILNLTGHNDSLLECKVNVTWDPGFVLSIFHDGCKLQPVDTAPGDADAALPYVTLSETVSLRSKGEYECQLHLNKELVTKSIFNYHAPVAADGADAENAEKNVATTVSEPGVVVFPEPWPLYMALLLVPITILLGLTSALLMLMYKY
ncbi:protein borderless-like [Sander vitreus]